MIQVYVKVKMKLLVKFKYIKCSERKKGVINA